MPETAPQNFELWDIKVVREGNQGGVFENTMCYNFLCQLPPSFFHTCLLHIPNPVYLWALELKQILEDAVDEKP